MFDLKKVLNSVKRDKGIILAAAWSFNQLAYAIVYPFIPIYLCNDRGFDYKLVSLIFPLLGLAAIVAPVPCGWLADKSGYKFTMLFGQAMRGVMFFLMAFLVYFNAPFWTFALTLMLNAAVGSAFTVGSDAYLFTITKFEDRPIYYSKIRIGLNLGWAVGPMLGAFFAKTPFWLFFCMTGILCMIGTAYTYYCCFQGGKIFEKVEKEKVIVTEKRSIKKDVFGNYRFLLLISGTLFLMMLASQLYSTMSIFATQKVGVTSKELGFIYSLNGFMVLALQIPIVAGMKKLNINVLGQLMIGVLLYIIGYMQLGFVGSAWTIAIAVAVITLGEISIQPALYTAVSGHTVKENAGRMFSINSLMRGIGYAVGPWVGGQLFAVCTPLVMWGLLSLFAVIAAVMFVFGTNGHKAENTAA